MLSQSLTLIECDRHKFNLYGSGSLRCSIWRKRHFQDVFFFYQFLGRYFVLRDNCIWPGGFKVRSGHGVDRRWQTEIHGCKRGMTAIQLSSRLQYAKNKMACERLCCSAPLLNIHQLNIAVHSYRGVVGCWENSIYVYGHEWLQSYTCQCALSSLVLCLCDHNPF